MTLSSQFVPHFQDLIENLTARLEPHQYLRNRGVYTDLSLRLLGQELTQLETDVGAVHSQLNNTQTHKLSKEVKQNMQSRHLGYFLRCRTTAYMSNMKAVFVKFYHIADITGSNLCV